jgi:uncharacterized protein
MGERTSHAPGTFSWADLSTTDPAAAKGFYGSLFGWDFDDRPVGDGQVYTMCRVDGHDVCALSAQQEQERSMGIPPHWNNYVTVADVDASTAKARELGANVFAEPFDVLEAGRMSVVADPAGAVFCMWQPRDSIGATVVNVPGALTWNELATKDMDAAKDFYGGLFGWSFEDMEGSPLPYSIIRNGERSNGGIRAQSPDEAQIPPYWIPYFAVESVDTSAVRAGELGGRVFMPPTAVPAGRFSVLADPQGAAVAIFEGDFDD